MAGLTQDPKTDSHPISIMVLRVLRKSEDQKHYAIHDTGKANLKGWVAKDITDGFKLGDCVRQMCVLAYFLETEKESPAAAQVLLDVAEELVHEFAAKGLDTKDAIKIMQQAGDRFSKFLGERPHLTAPLGAPPPPGSVKLSSLVPAALLRPRR